MHNGPTRSFLKDGNDYLGSIKSEELL